MSHDLVSSDSQDVTAPTGRPTELAGTDVLDVGGLVAHAVTVSVPGTRALENPMWALHPLVAAARAPEAHGAGGPARTHDGVPGRRLRVIVDIVDGDPLADEAPARDDGPTPGASGEQHTAFSVQELDDGFRQRRWLVESYAARWNELVDLANGLDDRTCDRTAAKLSCALQAELQERAVEQGFTRRVELECLLVRHLTGLKVLEAWRSAGRVVRVDEDALRGAITADIREVRPFGVVDALAYAAVSAGSETAAWGRDEADGRRPATFTRDEFFRWAQGASGYNRAFVTEALKAFPPTALYMGGALTRGAKGSGYPEVLGALRCRGEALLSASPARRLWAQGRAGTTIDEPAGPEPVILPRTPKRRG